MERDITAIGEVLIDLTQRETGELGIEMFAANPGGAPANVAVAASRLGSKTAFVGCVGNDHFGTVLRQTLESNNVDCTGLAIDATAPTTLAVVSVDSTGERSFSFYRESGADLQLKREHIPDELLSNSKVIHFGSLSLTDEPAKSAVISAVQYAREQGKLISYDPNYRSALWQDVDTAKSAMRSPLPLVDIMKISDEEMLLLTDYDELESVADALMKSGIRLVLITLGADGVFYKMGNMSGKVDGVKVKVADTNGAGDTFFGSFLSRFVKSGKSIEELSRKELEEMLAYANLAASITTSRSGAIPAMPTHAEVEEKLKLQSK